MKRKVNTFGLVSLAVVALGLLINFVNIIQVLVNDQFTGLFALGQLFYGAAVVMFIEYVYEVRTTKKEK